MPRSRQSIKRSPDANGGGDFTLKAATRAEQERLALKDAPGNGKEEKPQRRKRDSVRLVWDSKPKRPPSPRDIEFQTAEIVIPNPTRDAGSLPYGPRQGLLESEQIDKSKLNRLIWGDNLLAMQALLAQGYEGSVDLIYIDPPFDSKADYSHKLTLGGKEITKEPSTIERLAYRDTWEAGIDSYLDMIYPRLQLMRRLLSERGSIYFHCDWRLEPSMRLVMDEVFGRSNGRNAIVWKRTSAHNDPSRYGINDDRILYYTRSGEWTWTNPKIKYEDWYVERYYRYVDEKSGRRFLSRDVTGPAHGGTSGVYQWKGKWPGAGRMWAYTKENMTTLDAEGRLFYTENGIPRLKQYLDEMEGNSLQTIWDDILPIVSWSDEGSGYETQKPSLLIQRVVSASSVEGDLVADFFCGSGTTGLAGCCKMG